MPYVVLETRWDEGDEIIAGWSGEVLGRFETQDSAKALALQRIAYGDTGVVVVETATRKCVYPPDFPLALVARGSGGGR